jgi:hypothetical protein
MSMKRMLLCVVLGALGLSCCTGVANAQCACNADSTGMVWVTDACCSDPDTAKKIEQKVKDEAAAKYKGKGGAKGGAPKGKKGDKGKTKSK